MEGRRGDGPNQLGRLARLSCGRARKKVAETHGRRWPSYVGSVAWLGFGVLTVALVAQRSERRPVVVTLRAASGEVTRPLARVEPAALIAERAAKAGAARIRASEAADAPPQRPARPASTGQKALSAPASVRHPSVRRRDTTAPPVAASPLTAAVTTARRWSGYVPEAKGAIVRWVKSQPPSACRRLDQPDRPQAF